MVVFEFIVESFRNLRRHKLRSFLTTLGIVFGVASVVTMVAVGAGARETILEQIQELGTRHIILNARKPPEADNASEASRRFTLEFGLTFADRRRIAETVPFLTAVLPVHDVEKWIWFRSRRLSAKIRGVTPEYMVRLGLDPAIGRSLAPADGARAKRVCVIRRRLLDEAKFLGDPLKLDLRIGTDYYRVVGVLPNTEFQSANQVVLGIDDTAHEVYVPYETSLRRFGLHSYIARAGARESSRVELHQIVCVVDRDEHVFPAARMINAVLANGHRKQDYEMTVPLELLASQQRAQRVFHLVLPIIAGISLLVGGIGIMNIMLASITERTTEIGIRRAIGATQGHITRQFLVESTTLSAIGGMIGLAVGGLGVVVLAQATQWRVSVTGWSMAVSLLMSCATGVLFGLYPARRAAMMDPIEALRRG